MAGVREYSNNDRSLLTFSLVGVVLVISLLLVYIGNIFSNNTVSSVSSSEILSTLGIALYRSILAPVSYTHLTLPTILRV